MNASIANRIRASQDNLIRLSAPNLIDESRTPLRPPMATAPMARLLSLRSLIALGSLGLEVRCHA